MSLWRRDPKRARSSLAPSRHLRHFERGWYVVLIVGVSFVIFGAVVAGASVSPSFCALCHGADTRELQQSVHEDTRCDVCHTDRTAFGLIGNRLAVMRMVYDKAVPGESPQDSFVNSDPCLACHAGMLRQTTVTRNIRMNHKGLDPDVWPCTFCHPTVAHGSASYRKTGYNMDVCLPCHSTNPSNPATCETCHPGGAPTGTTLQDSPDALPTPWEVSHGLEAGSTHGMGNLDTCDACHAPEYCVSCHGLSLPHPPDYMRSHGEQAIASGAEKCSTCHQQASCDACHGVEMPHPSDFLPAHAEPGSGASIDLCARCHPPETCEECHIRSTHPGLPADVRDKLRERPTS